MTRGKAALAALVSLPLPGLGHALAGATRRALLFAMLALAMQALFLVMQATDGVTPFLLSLGVLWMVLMLAAALAVAADAWRLARIARPLAERGGRRRLLVLVSAVMALNLALMLLPGEPITWRSYHLPSASMLPTLVPGDRILVQHDWYGHNKLRRGDVVVFLLPGAGAAYVKRVIGLPGELVQMRRGVPVLDGMPLVVAGSDGMRRTWVLPEGRSIEVMKRGENGPADDTAAFLVPAGHVFMLGDNIDNSYDSRLDPRMRAVPLTALVGRVAIIYWPFNNGRFARMIR